jgi:N6-L-threonylcarbamoyladenine synthase
LNTTVTILAIESSCDDTSVAILRNNELLSNVIAGQDVHKKYGGVVPELASRAHQSNIVPVLHEALLQANIKLHEIDAIAFTRGPGLLGSLLVGISFAKGLSMGLQIPLIEVNHLQGHVLSHFIKENGEEKTFPEFPHLSLLVSGGHTQIIKVNSPYNFELLGTTIDDAAGEAFDKAAKVMGLGYPGGPVMDKLAQQGNKTAYKFSKPNIPDLNFSFSGLKTSFLYFLRDKIKTEPDFIKNNIHDLCASYQYTIAQILKEKITKAIKQTQLKTVTLGGGVSANSEIRKQLEELSNNNIQVFLPKLKFTTDNAAMIGIVGYYKYQKGIFASLDVTPVARFSIM